MPQDHCEEKVLMLLPFGCVEVLVQVATEGFSSHSAGVHGGGGGSGDRGDESDQRLSSELEEGNVPAFNGGDRKPVLFDGIASFSVCYTTMITTT
jgi:hypothetical protein